MANVSEPQSAQNPTPSAMRFQRLMAEDPAFAAALPSQAVVEAKLKPGLRIAQVVQIIMEGYADRPALGRRARELVSDPRSGRKTLRLLPKFETLSYRELWARARAIAGEFHGNAHAPLKSGDFVCILGFTSPDYAALLIANIHLGAVNVPLQTSAPTAQHAAIIAETEPKILAASIDYIDHAIDAVLAGVRPKRLVIFDYDARDDDQRETFEAARNRLATLAPDVTLDALDDIAQRGASMPPAPLYTAPPGEDPLSWLFYTSGSTGTPKGAIFTESLVIQTWLAALKNPVITLSFMPMSHLVGNGYLLLALANGGTSYCSPKADLSTLFEDFSLARPTMSSLVPRVCELFYHHYLGEVDRRVAESADAEAVADEIKKHIRENIMGGRLLSVGCGSASLAPETYAFMESMLGMHMAIGYASTEIAGGTVLVDWKIQRPPVIDYKLDDVPELGYFNTDKPHPRGELLVKTDRFMGGYYKQPELTAEKMDADGFYRTGDIMAQTGPDQLIFVDRRNNVVKLSQGEFIAISKLEALYSHSADIRQIYIYGTSERAYLLAVIVPSEDLAATFVEGPDGAKAVKASLRRALQKIAAHEQLNGYEIPRDFVVETEPFSLKNGLLSEVGKHQRPKLKARYAEALEELYARLAREQVEDLRALRTGSVEGPVIAIVTRALQATLGLSASDIEPTANFADLGGDSLSALSFSLLLQEIFGIEVPVGVIVNPTGNLVALADYIEAQRASGAKQPRFSTVHNTDDQTVRAADLKLEKFIDADTLAKAQALPKPSEKTRTVLLTGATGFLGRFQAMAWLEQFAQTGGKLILVTRAADAGQARERIEAALDTDPQCIGRFRALADKHLEVIAGDLGLPQLGLDQPTWDRLSETVDLIVHTGAHVNHRLPYNQLFTANVVGTAELIRLALTGRLKRFNYVSTLGVNALSPSLVDEDSDIRAAIPSCQINDSYANGYGISKWASEVLLREAHERFGMPVSVFRPGMILAHSTFAGQLNVPDMFTRLLYSLAVTGVAPATFYAEDLSAGRPRGRYEGFSVDYLADVITRIGVNDVSGFHSYNLAGSDDSGASLDTFVDWMVEAGCKIERIPRYSSWVSRFETAMNALSEMQRQQSMLAIMQPYRHPQAAVAKSALSVTRFRAASKAADLPAPPFSPALIQKYVSDLKYLKLL